MEAYCWSSLIIIQMTFDLYWLEIEACTGVNSDRLNKLLSYTEKGIFTAVCNWVSPSVQSTSPVQWLQAAFNIRGCTFDIAHWKSNVAGKSTQMDLK